MLSDSSLGARSVGFEFLPFSGCITSMGKIILIAPTFMPIRKETPSKEYLRPRYIAMLVCPSYLNLRILFVSKFTYFFVTLTPPEILALILQGLNTEDYSSLKEATRLLRAIDSPRLVIMSPKICLLTVSSSFELPLRLSDWPYLLNSPH